MIQGFCLVQEYEAKILYSQNSLWCKHAPNDRAKMLIFIPFSLCIILAVHVSFQVEFKLRVIILSFSGFNFYPTFCVKG